MQLLISSPWWFIVLCLLAGALYAFVLYQSKWANLWYKLCAIFRFVLVSLLCFFLLSPLLVQKVSTVQKPIVIMAMDNSQSILSNKDSAFYRTEFLKSWQNAKSILGSDYDVQYLRYGSQVSPTDSIYFNEKRSNIGQVFDYINNTYAKQNIGAVVLATDGIYNKGNNPLYKTLDNHAALYTIGMGDTTIKKDIIVKEVNVNAIAYLGNEFPIDINLAAYACANQNSQLNVSIDGKPLMAKTININQANFFQHLTLSATADQAGTKHIIITMSTIDGEVSKINNRKDVFIEVIDGREKILLTYNGPHPDIGALKEAIKANTNYEVVSEPISEVKLSDLAKYSVIILHQLPSRANNANYIINTARTAKIPLWCIVGNQSAIDLLPSVSGITKIYNNQGRMNESQAQYNTNFNTFVLEPKTQETLAELPPLEVPYGSYAASDNAEILAYQKIGAVGTKLPLWAMVNQNGEKTAVLFGEGFWRWRMADYYSNENHMATNELVSKTIQYLAVKDDKRKFRVYPSKNVYEEDEAVRFVAELYNSSYELVNQVDVKIELSNRDGKTFRYTFSPFNKSYQLDIGAMPAGIYQYKASADGLPDKVNGQILITPLQTELLNTTADFGALRQMANKNNGVFYKATELENALQNIKKNTGITSVSYTEKKTDELINLKWVFFLLLLLLTAEWFIRKYEGGY